MTGWIYRRTLQFPTLSELRHLLQAAANKARKGVGGRMQTQRIISAQHRGSDEGGGNV